MTDEKKIQFARDALAAYDAGDDRSATPLATALRDLLPEPRFDVWEIVTQSGCREEHKALATGLTKEGAQNYIARIDPAARRNLYLKERA